MVDIQYRNSESTREEPKGVPHTFARGETDVLFIPGGEAGDCQLVNCVEGRFRVLDDRFYSGFGVPLVGAEKVLEFGGKPRFDVNTMEVPRPAFDKVIKQPDAARWIAANQIDSKGLEDLRKKYEAEAPALYRINMNVEGITRADDYSGEAPAAVMKKYREPLITDKFFALIEHFNEELGQPEQKIVLADPKPMAITTWRISPFGFNKPLLLLLLIMR